MALTSEHTTTLHYTAVVHSSYIVHLMLTTYLSTSASHPPRSLPVHFLFALSPLLILAMSTFAGNEKWRNHPALRVRVKHLFPGFMWGLGAVVVVSVAEMFMPAAAAAGHGATAAHGESGKQTSAAKSTGEGGHGVH